MASVQRRLNSTGRTRITRDCVSISLEYPLDKASTPWVSAGIDLSDYDFPADACVSLEAYYRSSSMRFDCGNVGELSVPPQMLLSDIDRGGAVRFRLLVIASDRSGRILGAAEGLRPVVRGESSDKKPLLPLREMVLDGELWRIEIDHRDGPTLCVNNAVVGLAAQIRASALFQGLVLPHALRVILMLLSTTGEDEEDGFWGDDWRIFLKQIGVEEPPEANEPDAVEEWIDSAVRTFCGVHDFVSRIDIRASLIGSPND